MLHTARMAIKKAPGEKHKMIIDPVTAPVVREIFWRRLRERKALKLPLH